MTCTLHTIESKNSLHDMNTEFTSILLYFTDENDNTELHGIILI